MCNKNYDNGHPDLNLLQKDKEIAFGPFSSRLTNTCHDQIKRFSIITIEFIAFTIASTYSLFIKFSYNF